MSRKGYYSPVLRRDLITRLHYAAKASGTPMTVLADRLVEEALDHFEASRVLPMDHPDRNPAQPTRHADSPPSVSRVASDTDSPPS